MQPFGRNRYGQKIGRLFPFGGAGSPCNTMSPGPTSTSLPCKWHLDPCSRLATTDTGRKIGVGVVVCRSLWGAGSSYKTMWPGPRPTPVPSGTLIHAAVWPQQTWTENWGLFPFFREGELGPHVKQCGRAEAYLHAKFILESSNHLATMHQCYRQTGQTDRQRLIA